MGISLGQGSYGEVYKVDKDGVKYALKMVIDFNSRGYTELDILSRLSSPYVISLHEAFYNPRNLILFINERGDMVTKYIPVYFIVMELAQTSLNGRGWMPSKIDDSFVLHFLFNLFCGLSYINRNGILHGDINPDNILIQGGIPKYADFGISEYIHHPPKRTKLLYTEGYRAPEVDKKSLVYYSTDTWALAVTIFKTLFKKDPTKQKIDPYSLFRGDMSASILSKVVFLLNKCLDPNPLKRPTATKILEVWTDLFSQYTCIVSFKEFIYPIPPRTANEWIIYRKTKIQTLYSHLDPETLALAVSIVDRYAHTKKYKDINTDIFSLSKIIATALVSKSELPTNKNIDDVVKSLHYELYVTNVYTICKKLDALQVMEIVGDFGKLQEYLHRHQQCWNEKLY